MQEYTFYELLYEFYDKMERKNAQELRVEQEADKIEQEEQQGVLDWIEEEERKEREAEEAKAKAEAEKAAQDKEAKNVQEQEDEAWMLEQLKKQYGEDFGEDINQDFSE